MVKVYIDRLGDKGEIKVKNVQELIDMFNINISEYIVVKNGELVNHEASFCEKDSVKLLSVVSGG
ncbi:thiamine biosynthesis protein ThiS [Candidatus Woesearchaeota archaeon]|jgi:sulfur carrier protein ThiS|nr:thiamine biosynthesis protein ThiS [Candidatus Woesearchaeota archaeon]MBT4835522.1 thiamine biosynthesis protein ThiS [Candidatus Woesearchaeota archaeon]MBT6734792.1 thiamine biosynthesis protein ThiS [Candidatus Woesearchaeota archaeon]MBT7169968.1 thiamine biosynthesis protein ThiS [Candidatus Woesearchaeota archaeon]MBT7474480.1 thiamine biosynthesis protein ThiS [Candidatus Woesearchaeota archaeon]